MTVQYVNTSATQIEGTITVTEVDGSPIATNVNTLKLTDGSVSDITGGVASISVGTGTGNGDVVGPASSVNNEIALFNSTSGKIIKRASISGVLKAAAGVLQAATPGTDYAAATSGTSILKGNGAGGFSAAVAKTDYAPATSGAALLKGDNLGGFASAAAGTDYLAPVMTTVGDLVYGGASGAQTRLPGSTSATRKYLSQAGTGSASASPKWVTVTHSSMQQYYFSDVDSDIATYKKLNYVSLPDKIENTAASVNGTVTLLTWATPLNFPNVLFVPAGVFEIHVHAKQTAGTNATNIYGELWEVTVAGVDVVLLGTSDQAGPLTGSEVEYPMFFDEINTHLMQSSESRLAVKIKATSSGGTPATVVLSYGGTADSHISVPVNMVDANTFIPYVNATKDFNLGHNDFRTGGNVTFDINATHQILINTDPRESNSGVIRVNHEAGSTGTRPFYIDVEANGYGNTNGMVIDYITGAMDSSKEGHVHSVFINGTGATGGNVQAVSVSAIPGSLSSVTAFEANQGVGALSQWAGTWTQTTQSWYYNGSTYTNVTSGSNQVFQNQNDYVYVGAGTSFTNMNIIISIGASTPIFPTFEYWNGTAWVVFVPVDMTNGFRESGSILWGDGATTGWTSTSVNGVTRFYIRIKRTVAVLPTPPTVTSLETSNPTHYQWNASGDVTVRNVSALTLNSTVATGAAPFTVSSTTPVANLSIGGTAANSTNSTITNDTATNATMYPLWVTATTGNQPSKVSSTKLSFNPSSGILTATGFSGNVTGNVTGSAATVTSAAQANITSLGTLTTLTIGAGTTTVAPLKLTSGTNLTTPQAGAFEFNGTNLYFTPSTVRYTLPLEIPGAATLGAGWGTGASVTGTGTKGFQITVGTGPSSTGVVNLPTAPNGWVAYASNVTGSGTRIVQQSATSTTAVTLASFLNSNGNSAAFVAGDVITVMCQPY